MSTNKIFDNKLRLWYNEITIKQRPKNTRRKSYVKEKELLVCISFIK